MLRYFPIVIVSLVTTLTGYTADPSKPEADAEHWSFLPVKRPPLPRLPADKTDIRNDVDRFIVAKLQESGLQANPQADRRTLIRRLKFDLLGLPPTPEEVDAFTADTTADAYEKLVERYLASPHFGERWARHWLDIVRFADSHGFEMNNPRPGAYYYRDYVIRSFNEDKPYDQFVREQLAGDTMNADAATGFLVGGPWDQVKSPDPGLTANQRADEMHDIIGTTGSTFLGLTVACARCHAHKFDPIPQSDYYRVKAVFAGVQHGERQIRTSAVATKKPDVEKYTKLLAEAEAKLAAMEPLADPAAKAVRRQPVNAQQNVERFTPAKAKFVRFTILATNSSEPCIDELEVHASGDKPMNLVLASTGAKTTASGSYAGATDLHRLEFIHDGKYGNGRSWISSAVGRGWVEMELPTITSIDRVVWGRDREGKFVDRVPTRYQIEVSVDRATWTMVASSNDRAPFGSGKNAATPAGLNETERAEWTKLNKQIADLRRQLTPLTQGISGYIGRFGSPEMTYRLHRGEATQKKEVVDAGVLSQVGPSLTIPTKATDPERRAAFAKWITDAQHPLTARVIVNRLWQFHFGTGIVDTPSDLGNNGGKPTHPELLDYLASELITPTGQVKPWSMKHIHRLIVTSATYRQASTANAAGMAKDAQSRLLWRYPPRRIEAEPLRDAFLFVSGKLDLSSTGGPGFDLFQPNGNYVRVFTPKTEFGPAEFRRMVYQHKPRMQLDDTFGAFDCPDAGQIAPKRNVSVTPLQALNLLNSRFLLQQSSFLAERAKEAGADPVMQVKQVFRLAFQRQQPRRN